MTGAITPRPRLGRRAPGPGPARRRTATAAVARDQPGSGSLAEIPVRDPGAAARLGPRSRTGPQLARSGLMLIGAALACCAANLCVLDGRRSG